MEKSRIAKFYSGQNVLVTGATGFMGKILIEKLLRSCPEVDKIYILVRGKKGQEPGERIYEILNSPIFDQIRDNNEQIFDKLAIIPGDITEPQLNLSPQHKTLLEATVTSVFHMAANVRFDQPLKSAVELNTGGTKNLLDVACHFERLRVLVHVSTSYCHCDEVNVEERLYRAPHDPRKILDLVSWMDDDTLAHLTPRLMKNSPNTYAYTKCLTEHLVSEYSSRLPLAIARPSIVTAVWKEPLPGWVDNLNGPTGILVGAGKGVIRTMHCNEHLDADIVPVDSVINSLLTIGWKVGTTAERGSRVEVYNVTCDKDNTITWGGALNLGRKHFYDNPFSVCLWYPGGSIKSWYFVHLLAVFFLHIVPAYVVDLFMVLTGNKPFLVRTQKRIQNGLEVLQYYTTRPWFFHTDRLDRLYDELNATDKRIFYTNRDRIDYSQYLLSYVLGARRYCIHEEPETIPHARKVLKRLFYLDVVKNVLLALLLLWIFQPYASVFLQELDLGSPAAGNISFIKS